MTCTHCTAPTADGIYLCDTAEGDLFALLGQIPDTLADAQDTIARLERKGPVSYTHLTLPTTCTRCRSRWSPYH